ncbi:MAG TPA: hypothetical protein VK709_13455 [Candidatus Saccharimonadales bacterium]|nr:hypothetical protein [Candidatus Saccharimonadales bacterium]
MLRFATRQVAEKHRIAHEDTRPVDKGEMRTYRCPNCGGFHNGHSEPRSPKADHGYRRGVVYFGVGGMQIKFTIGEHLIQQWRQDEVHKAA